MPDFIVQNYRNLQNVNADNMNTFYKNVSQELSAFFPAQPSICNGIGKIQTNFGQFGTTNTFNFVMGVIRFVDQAMPTLGNPVLPAFANCTTTNIVITAAASPPAQLYVVALLTLTPVDAAYRTKTSAVILPTAMSLADIALQPVPELYMPIFAITNQGGGVYTVSIDSNCAFNYGYLLNNPFPDITDTNGLVTIPAQFINTYNNGLTTRINRNNFDVGNINGILTLTSDNVSLNYAAVSTGVDIVTGDATASLIGAVANIQQYGMTVSSNQRPFMSATVIGNITGIPGSTDIVIGANLPFIQYFQVDDDLGNLWNLVCISRSSNFPTSQMTIFGLGAIDFNSGTTIRTIDLTAAIASAVVTQPAIVNLSLDNKSLYAARDITQCNARTVLGNSFIELNITAATSATLATASFYIPYF